MVARTARVFALACALVFALSAAAVYRTGKINLNDDWVNWNASGYRLPTEAQWERAARGGTEGHRFPWTDADTIKDAAEVVAGMRTLASTLPGMPVDAPPR